MGKVGQPKSVQHLSVILILFEGTVQVFSAFIVVFKIVVGRSSIFEEFDIGGGFGDSLVVIVQSIVLHLLSMVALA